MESPPPGARPAPGQPGSGLCAPARRRAPRFEAGEHHGGELRKAWKETFHAGTPCVDWFHVAQYLWDAADAVFRVTRPSPKGKRAKKAYAKEKDKVQADKSKWVRARQDELLAGEVDAVLGSIRELQRHVGASGPGTRTRRKALTDATTYVENHREYLTYAKIGHVVMGTGVVEGTIKQLGARLKGPGMRWSVERAERVLALRCLQLSHEPAWARFTERIQETHEALSNPHVPAISPSGRVTAHTAVRKVA